MSNYKYYKRYCSDIENVENFEKAKDDNFKGWCCHHRLQTWTSDGERRLVNISADELKSLGMYYNRPAEELIFLTSSEHSILHNKGENNPNYGKHFSEEHKIKIGEGNRGKQLTEETKHKISLAKIGKRFSDKTRRKMSAAKKGKHFSEEHKRKIGEASRNRSEETRKKLSAVSKGTSWYNNGKTNIRAKECPLGFIPGRLLIK